MLEADPVMAATDAFINGSLNPGACLLFDGRRWLTQFKK